jgi:hypothetical protein
MGGKREEKRRLEQRGKQGFHLLTELPPDDR